jgi:hypothetical protein
VKKLAEMETIVGADNGVSRSRRVSALIKASQESQVVQYQIENDQRKATELLRQSRAAQQSEKRSRRQKIWARRVHGLVIDSFATAKSHRKRHSDLEETLHANLTERQLKRMVEIRRMDRVLFVRGGIKPHFPNRKSTTIAPLMCTAGCLHQLRNTADQLPTQLSSFSRPSDHTLVQEKYFPVLKVV